MKNTAMLAVSLLTGVALHGETRTNAVQVSAGDDLPGLVVQSWLANSFSRQQGHHSVPVTAIGIAVTPDGTVFSAGVAEGYGGVASYKDGEFVTKYDYDSGFGSSASAVAVDGSYVYIGTGVGLFRTRLGGDTPDTGYGGGSPLAMQARGKYLFVAYGYGLIRVHRLDDGSYVGTIRPNINGFKGSGGCVDSDNALNVTLRKSGEYVLFLENAGLNHVMMFRWPPQED